MTGAKCVQCRERIWMNQRWHQMTPSAAAGAAALCTCCTRPYLSPATLHPPLRSHCSPRGRSAGDFWTLLEENSDAEFNVECSYVQMTYSNRSRATYSENYIVQICNFRVELDILEIELDTLLNKVDLVANEGSIRRWGAPANQATSNVYGQQLAGERSNRCSNRMWLTGERVPLPMLPLFATWTEKVCYFELCNILRDFVSMKYRRNLFELKNRLIAPTEEPTYGKFLLCSNNRAVGDFAPQIAWK